MLALNEISILNPLDLILQFQRQYNKIVNLQLMHSYKFTTVIKTTLQSQFEYYTIEIAIT